MPLTNQQFGDRIGCHHSMASRIRSGDRMPGPNLIQRISEEYGIPMKTMMDARNRGEEAMGRLIRARCFAPVEKAEKEAAKANKATLREAAKRAKVA